MPCQEMKNKNKLLSEDYWLVSSQGEHNPVSGTIPDGRRAVATARPAV